MAGAGGSTFRPQAPCNPYLVLTLIFAPGHHGLSCVALIYIIRNTMQN